MASSVIAWVACLVRMMIIILIPIMVLMVIIIGIIMLTMPRTMMMIFILNMTYMMVMMVCKNQFMFHNYDDSPFRITMMMMRNMLMMKMTNLP